MCRKWYNMPQKHPCETFMKHEKNPNQKAFKIISAKKQISVARPEEPPAPEIDTKKAVAFAMAIAQEMKQRQREADEAK